MGTQLEALLFEDHLKQTRTQTYSEAATWAAHTAEIKVPSMPYDKMVQHRAAICLPYDTTIFLFNELYSANMPLFVPRDLWRWMMGPSTAPSMEYRSESALQNHDSGTNSLYPMPELSPFYAAVHRPM